jgi:hypothetical protein
MVRYGVYGSWGSGCQRGVQAMITLAVDQVAAESLVGSR